MTKKERIYKILFNNSEKVEMKIVSQSERPNAMFFTKYQALFKPDEWVTINLIEGELIPLLNQLDEINRDKAIKEYKDFRTNLNAIWETYTLEREAIRLNKNQEKDFGNGIKIIRIE